MTEARGFLISENLSLILFLISVNFEAEKDGSWLL